MIWEEKNLTEHPKNCVSSQTTGLSDITSETKKEFVKRECGDIGKQCRTCLERKSLDDFYRDARGKFGRYGSCKNAPYKVNLYIKKPIKKNVEFTLGFLVDCLPKETTSGVTMQLIEKKFS